jgi:hypothetical protein
VPILARDSPRFHGNFGVLVRSWRDRSGQLPQRWLKIPTPCPVGAVGLAPEYGRRSGNTLATLMRVRRRAVILAILFCTPAAATAALSNLSPEQVAAAIDHGRRVYDERVANRLPIDDLEPPYVADLGPQIGRALLYTEFSALALEAGRFRAIGRELTRAEIDRVLKPLRGRLRFSVTLVGSTRDFLRSYTAELVQGEHNHRSETWDVFRASQRTSGSWVAAGHYVFAVSDVDLAAPVTLVLRDTAGQEIRFEFALGAVR